MPAQPDFAAALAALDQALAALPPIAVGDQEPKFRLDYLRSIEQLLAAQMRIHKLQGKYKP